MARYLLNVIQPDGDPPPPDVLEPILRDLRALHEQMRAAGAWVFSCGLASASAATVVRVRDGDVLLTDGPFAEGKEHVGGFTIVEAADLDEALEWAARSSRATTLPIE